MFSGESQISVKRRKQEVTIYEVLKNEEEFQVRCILECSAKPWKRVFRESKNQEKGGTDFCGENGP